jgi:cytochrome c-type biogenesis protein
MMEDFSSVPTVAQAFHSGLLTAVSPCALFLGPAILLCAIGSTLPPRTAVPVAVPGWKLRVELLIHLIVFLAGFFVVLVGLAASQTAVGHILLLGQGPLTVVGGLLTIIRGVFLTGLVPRFPRRTPRELLIGRLSDRAAFGGIGALLAFVWPPCGGPVLGAIVIAAGSPETSDLGIPLLLVHGLGFGIPLLLGGAALGGIVVRASGRRVAGWIESAAGALLVAGGFLIAIGKFSVLGDQTLEFFDRWVQALIEGGW